MATRDTRDPVPDTAKATATSQGPDTGPLVKWDDSSMRTAYANVCNVIGTREEIMLLFGANQAWQSGQKEVRVVLSDRVVLNPYAAKRLYRMLEKGLKEYEVQFGELKA
jgi:Protein of unknown function (DUF3467)